MGVVRIHPFTFSLATYLFIYDHSIGGTILGAGNQAVNKTRFLHSGSFGSREDIGNRQPNRFIIK